MQNYHDLLIEATEKLIDLSDKSEFKNEFLFRAPPLLWFGNNSNNKEKILKQHKDYNEQNKDNKAKYDKELYERDKAKIAARKKEKVKVLPTKSFWYEFDDYEDLHNYNKKFK